MSLCVAWVYSLHFPRCGNRGAPRLPGFLGCCAGVCCLHSAPPPAPSPGMLAPSWRLGSGLGRWRVVIGLHHLQPFLYKLIKENTGKRKTKPSRDGVTSFVLGGRGKGAGPGGTGLQRWGL